MRTEYDFSKGTRGSIVKMFERRWMRRRIKNAFLAGIKACAFVFVYIGVLIAELACFIIGFLITIPYCLFHWSMAASRLILRKLT